MEVIDQRQWALGLLIGSPANMACLVGDEGSLHFVLLLRCGVLGASTCARPRYTEPPTLRILLAAKSWVGDSSPPVRDQRKETSIRRSLFFGG
jgi:hypothetical protein